MGAADGLRVVTVAGRGRERWAEGIRALAEEATYPLGDDRFRIDRGADVFAFLDRLGTPVLELALAGERVVAMSARVLRRRPRRAWYLCDLKVHPEFRGRRIAARFVRHAFARAYARCGRGYAVSMNGPGEDPSTNPVARLVERIGFVPFRTHGLELFELGPDEERALRPVIEARRGPLWHLSLAGVKDIVLESTGAPMPLLHAQWGPCAAPAAAPGSVPSIGPGQRSMLCAPAGDPLGAALVAAGLRPTATATVLHHRLGPGPLDFLLTSDI